MSTRTPLVLYLDDSADARDAFAAALGTRYEVVCAATADEALAVARGRPVDVVVSAGPAADATRPELLARLHEARPPAVLVAVVADRSVETLARALGDDLAVRSVPRPREPAELAPVLDWAVTLAAASDPDSELQRRARALERLALLGGITASALHEVNQPLSYLSVNSERLGQLAQASGALAGLVARHGEELDPESRRKLADLAEELPEIVRDMVEGCRVMRSLTTGVRAIGSAPPPAEARACDPHAVIEYVVGACRKLAVSARATLAYAGPDALPQARIPSGELGQALIAVVANAVDSVAAAGRNRGRVEISATADDDAVLVAVSDDGAGMTADVLAFAGTPFFSTKPGGAGLGLSMAHRLVSRAGGSIELASTPGAGATVTLTLPRVTAG